MALKPPQPSPESYTPATSSSVSFRFEWKATRVHPDNIPATFPFSLPLVGTRFRVQFLEFRANADPPPDIGNPGDIWFNVSPQSYALFALNRKREWIRWTGSKLDFDSLIYHPYIPMYALWCTITQASWYHRDKLQSDWAGDKLTARQALGGYASPDAMLEADVGVRLILLSETKESTGSSNPTAGPTPPPIDDLLISVLGQSAGSSAISETKDTLIATLTTGINFLLEEGAKREHAVTEAEKRAATAEQKLAALARTPSRSYYRDNLFPVPTIERPDNHCRQPSVLPPSAADLKRTTSEDLPAPAAKRRKSDLQSTATTPQSALTASAALFSTPFPPLCSPPTALQSKHLRVIFRPTSSHCLICLALVPHTCTDESPLRAHVLENHPYESGIFVAASDEELEIARRALESA
ncbi:hypothetical protein C8J57DRAFT_1534698 [Mycena rebaudengoi]|nr:hypothetical protein C8J57DRAFT_1534698 [Mycena rebaudengoi]